MPIIIIIIVVCIIIICRRGSSTSTLTSPIQLVPPIPFTISNTMSMTAYGNIGRSFPTATSGARVVTAANPTLTSDGWEWLYNSNVFKTP